MIKKANVAILLSTYNGERYLREQLNSLYAQTYPNISIYVRDDGSVDSTLNILIIEQSKGRLKLVPSGVNLGPAASFFKLLQDVPSDSVFFAFCDQDDVWDIDKIERAVDALKEIPGKVASMFCTRVTYVYSDNQFIKFSKLPRLVGFGNALVENIATGCTIVLNQTSRTLLLSNFPQQYLMHDAWCYLVISSLGKVIFDPVAKIRYRQHSSNTVGASMTVIGTFRKRLKNFSFKRDGVFRYSNQANQFLALFGDIVPEQHKHLLLLFVEARDSLWKRLSLVFSNGIWRQSAIDNLILRIMIFINRY